MYLRCHLSIKSTLSGVRGGLGPPRDPSGTPRTPGWAWAPRDPRGPPGPPGDPNMSASTKDAKPKHVYRYRTEQTICVDVDASLPSGAFVLSLSARLVN